MSTAELTAEPAPLKLPSGRWRAVPLRRGAAGWLLLALPTLYFAVLFAWPLLSLLRMAFAAPISNRITGEGFSLVNFKLDFGHFQLA